MKAAAGVLAILLILLGTWAYFAYQEYGRWDDGTVGPLAQNPPSPTLKESIGRGFKFVFGVGLDGSIDAKPTESVKGVRVALGAVIALCATIVFAVTGGRDSLFTVALATCGTVYCAVAHVLTAAVLLFTVSLETVAHESSYGFALYANLLYCAVSTGAAVNCLRLLKGLVRGEARAFRAVLLSLLAMLAANAPLIPIWIVPNFGIGGFSGAAVLSGLTLLALVLLGLTSANFSFDSD